jgi:glutamate/tyrosine decarboxylase-like PLP-dependent enzyme
MKEREAMRKMFDAHPEIARRIVKLIDARKLLAMNDPTIDGQDIGTVVCSSSREDIDDSVSRLCACGKRVWLSPSTQEVIAARGPSPTRVICVQCWMKELKS